jgi:hypothetical protein
VEIVTELRGAPRRGVKKEAGELVGDSKQGKKDKRASKMRLMHWTLQKLNHNTTNQAASYAIR